MAFVDTSDTFKQIFEIIDQADLAPDGLDEETHLTLIYGLHEEVTPNDVRMALKDATGAWWNEYLTEFQVTSISLFENERNDVLKLNVRYPDLEIEVLRNALLKLPNTQKFPEYIPHVTLAYLKPGAGKKYAIERKFNLPLPVKNIVYSYPGAQEQEIIR